MGRVRLLLFCISSVFIITLLSYYLETHNPERDSKPEFLYAITWKCPGDLYWQQSMSMQVYTHRKDKIPDMATFNSLIYRNKDLFLAPPIVGDAIATILWNGRAWVAILGKEELSMDKFYRRYPSACELPRNHLFVY